MIKDGSKLEAEPIICHLPQAVSPMDVGVSRDPAGALASVAQWIECKPANQKVTGSIPSGHVPGLWARSPAGGVQEATD